MGAMISALTVTTQGSGPEPIPFKQLTVESLTAAFLFVLTPEAQSSAKRLGSLIRNEVRVDYSFGLLV